MAPQHPPLSTFNDEDLRGILSLLKEELDRRKGIIGIPVEVFSFELAPAEAVVKFLKEERNMRFAQIGKVLHRSEGAVKLLMFRARQALRHCLDQKLRKLAHE